MTNIKISFAEGCFDDFEGTQEELEDLINEITRLVETGEIFESFEVLSKEEEKEILECLEKKALRQ